MKKIIYTSVFILFSLSIFAQFSSAIEIKISDNPDTLNTCGGGIFGTNFTDSHSDTLTTLGIPTGYIYGQNENYTKTLCSDNGQSITVNFSDLIINIGDHLYIYDGPSTASTLISDVTNVNNTGNSFF